MSSPSREARSAGWIAPWIWIAETPSPHAAVFRREFTIASDPAEALIYLSADSTYRFWINGRLTARGPADIGMDYSRVQTGKWFYDVWDVKHLLRDGANVLAAEVFAERLIGWEGTRGTGGLLCELELRSKNGALQSIRADGTWKARPAEHWRRQAQPAGHWQYDGSAEPAGWREPGFDDSGWSLAIPIADLWQPILMSELPARMEASYPASGISSVPPRSEASKSGAFPLLLQPGEHTAVNYDRVLSAFVGIRVRGGPGGTLLIQPNEQKAPGFHRMASIALSGAEQTVELPFLDSFSTINLQTTGTVEAVEILDVRANFISLSVAYRGSFECSDDGLNRLWKTCRWATQICLQTHHLDSPHHQEPISDPGDYLIESLVNYCAFHQPALTRQDARKYAWILGQCRNRCFHTSYALLWLQMVLDYYDYTGDESLVQELAPAIHSLLDTFTSYRGKNGLISESPNYMFMDWVQIAGFACHHPPAVIGQGYMTAFYHRGLTDGTRVARLTGDTARLDAYSKLKSATEEAFNHELWDPGKGLYRDGKPFQTTVKPSQWLPADSDIETFSPHVNLLAALYDIAPKDRQSAIVEKAITGAAFDCQPYFMHFAIDAIAHAGLFEKYGVDQMRRWKIIDETKSLREMWDTGDYSHGWGATPLYQMSTRILGVSPLSPGFTKIAVSPSLPAELKWAKGSLPTPRGDVKVEWHRGSDGEIRLEVDIPEGTTAQIDLPAIKVMEMVTGGRHSFVGKTI